MQLIRGTTPTLVINVKSDIDLTAITQVWVYISQRNVCKVDKKIEDVQIDPENKKILATLTQDDTLELSAGDALYQIRLLLSNGTALATIASKATVAEIYKGGVIQ